ncbi:uncharacterized protein PHALS_08884 [Plasmopara halstedii]|uniref:Uncharacterized protein n=1 Tax=Plasmopara halstedii TaxID=4781 RepID=A0A0P1AD36_PLAHL|nr:uncharacterized protein PHALS_08884 [Plasmopara halstedii]CEG38833.1 hypothetical protein PHALS_08884 [Plasmopara halstedii]|eukprot:XP_024575202.1 hypothetical protein PHALS_08884 [Plasmopara halstedii]
MLENAEVPKGTNDIMKKKEDKTDPRYRMGNTALNFPDEDNAGEDKIYISVAVRGQLQIRTAKTKDGELSTGYSFVSLT